MSSTNTLQIDPSLLFFSQWIATHNLSYGVKEWNEADHPRGQPDNKGQFVSGGGGTSSTPTPSKTAFSKSSGFSGEEKRTLGEKIHSSKQAIYDKLPSPVKSLLGAFGKAYGVYHKVEHVLETPYRAAQNLALAVARERGLSHEHVDRVARILSITDTVKRWTGNIPIAHHLLEHVAHIGGPLGFLGAKVGFYVPVASLAYLSSHLARETIGGKNPVALLQRANARIKAVKAAKASTSIGGTEHGGH